jgi:excisionase family DNA binding protein
MGAQLPTIDEIRAAVREELSRVLEELRGSAPASAEWATPEQAAEILGKTPKTVRRWAASGRLRATREGSRWRIDRAALPATKPASPEEHARAALVALPGRR